MATCSRAFFVLAQLLMLLMTTVQSKEQLIRRVGSQKQESVRVGDGSNHTQRNLMRRESPRLQAVFEADGALKIENVANDSQVENSSCPPIMNNGYYVMKISDAPFFVGASGGTSDGKYIKLSNSPFGNSVFQFVKNNDGTYQMLAAASGLGLHAWGGSKPKAYIRLHGDRNYGKTRGNSKFRFECVGGPLFIIKVSDKNLYLHAWGGSKLGAQIRLHGNKDYAKKRANSKFMLMPGVPPPSAGAYTFNYKKLAKAAVEMSNIVYRDAKTCPSDWKKEAEKVYSDGLGGKDHLYICSTGSSAQKECMMAFSGTSFNEPGDVLNDLNMVPKEVTIGGKKMQVHTGFYTEYHHIVHEAPIISGWSENSATKIKQEFGCKKLHLTGHSLGGAIADLYLMEYYSDIEGVFTFAAPMPYYSRQAGKKPYDVPCKNRAYRFQILHDALTGVPGQVLGFWHGPMKRRLFKCCFNLFAPDDKKYSDSDNTCQEDSIGMWDSWNFCIAGVCGPNSHSLSEYKTMINHFMR